MYLDKVKNKLLVSSTNFTPTAGATVPVGTICYKSALNRNGKNTRIVVMMVTKPGIVPSRFDASFQGLYRGKFRVREVLTLDIVDVTTGRKVKTAHTFSGPSTRYEVGKLTAPDGFTTDISDDCGQGIHVFADVKKAYNL